MIFSSDFICSGTLLCEGRTITNGVVHQIKHSAFCFSLYVYTNHYKYSKGFLLWVLTTWMFFTKLCCFYQIILAWKVFQRKHRRWQAVSSEMTFTIFKIKIYKQLFWHYTYVDWHLCIKQLSAQWNTCRTLETSMQIDQLQIPNSKQSPTQTPFSIFPKMIPSF